MADSKPVVNLARVPFSKAEIASVRVVDTDLILVLKNGQRVTVRDGAMRSMLDPEWRIAMVDGEVLGSDLLKQVGKAQVGVLAETTVQPADAGTREASGAPAEGGSAPR